MLLGRRTDTDTEQHMCRTCAEHMYAVQYTVRCHVHVHVHVPVHVHVYLHYIAHIVSEDRTGCLASMF